MAIVLGQVVAANVGVGKLAIAIKLKDRRPKTKYRAALKQDTSTPFMSKIDTNQEGAPARTPFNAWKQDTSSSFVEEPLGLDTLLKLTGQRSTFENIDTCCDLERIANICL